MPTRGVFPSDGCATEKMIAWTTAMKERGAKTLQPAHADQTKCSAVTVSTLKMSEDDSFIFNIVQG